MTSAKPRKRKIRRLLKQRDSSSNKGARGHRYQVYISNESVSGMQALYEWDGATINYQFPGDWRVQDMAERILEEAIHRLIADRWGGPIHG